MPIFFISRKSPRIPGSLEGNRWKVVNDEGFPNKKPPSMRKFANNLTAQQLRARSFPKFPGFSNSELYVKQ
jgi:hypothetical protein